MPGERQQVVVRELLVRKHQHVVSIPHGFDRFDFGFCHVREVDAFDFGADRAGRKDLDVVYGGHADSPCGLA
jgi:hypothetical protein